VSIADFAKTKPNKRAESRLSSEVSISRAGFRSEEIAKMKLDLRRRTPRVSAQIVESINREALLVREKMNRSLP
jgi:hypothetical protein